MHDRHENFTLELQNHVNFHLAWLDMQLVILLQASVEGGQLASPTSSLSICHATALHNSCHMLTALGQMRLQMQHLHFELTAIPFVPFPL